MNRSQKAEEIKNLQKTFQDNELVVVTQYRGMTVEDITNLRVKTREAGVSYKVSKNTLTRLATKGTSFECLGEMLKGPTAIAASKDPIAAAKVTVEFAKGNEKLIIVGGSYNGQILTEAGVRALASMPSLDELRGKIVGLLVAPATRVATVLQAPASQLARVTQAYATKG